MNVNNYCLLVFVISFSSIKGNKIIGDKSGEDGPRNEESNLISGESESYFEDEPEIIKYSKTTVKLKLHPIRQRYLSVNVSAYYVIVELRQQLANKSLFDLGSIDLTSNYSVSKLDEKPYYAAIRLFPDELKDNIEIVIGTDMSTEDYPNPKLDPNSEYRFGLAALIGNNKFIYIHSSMTIYTKDNDNLASSWIFFVSLFLLVAIVLIFIFFYVLRGKPEKPRSSLFNNIEASHSRDRLTLLTPTAYEKEEDEFSIERKSFNELRQFEPKSHPIPLNELSDCVANMIEDNTIRQEFTSIPRGQWSPWDTARMPENKGKNRYGNLLAYDFNRVVLQVSCDDFDDEKIINNVNRNSNILDTNYRHNSIHFLQMQQPNERQHADTDIFVDDEGLIPTDYINASFIDGYRLKNRYIATQGPLPGTIRDFWKMIWQTRSSQIVMLTNIEELGKMKCDKYWPENCSTYGAIKVKLTRTEVFADYIIRKFFLSKKDSGALEVSQYHFTSWPDHAVPIYTTALIAFMKRIRAESVYSDSERPMVVHCSAGVGRTGTFIVIDAMLQLASEEKTIDILNHLCTVRSQRINMVEKFPQYVFIHQILVEAICKDNSDFDIMEFDKYLNNLDKLDSNSMKSLIMQQFDILNKLTRNSSEKEISGAALANPTRNRHQDIVPSNIARVIIPSTGNDNYINAVYINGYKKKDAFVVTEVPLPETRSVFWRMIEYLNVKLIVLLDQLSSDEIYWPRNVNERTNFDDVHVEILEENENVLFSSKQIRVNGKKTVTLLVYKGWDSNVQVISDLNSFLDFIEEVNKFQIQTQSTQIVVQCLNGCTASGVFCCISFICDRIRGEQRIDVFLATSNARTHRRQFIEHLSQYRLLHDIGKSFIDRYILSMNGTLVSPSLSLTPPPPPPPPPPPLPLHAETKFFI